MTDHPITPPPELVEQWADEAWKGWRGNGIYEQDIAHQAARWGADMELEACCDFLQELLAPSEWITGLRAARRPKPPSLKEQALAALQEAAYMADDSPPQGICGDQIDIIRRALNELPE